MADSEKQPLLKNEATTDYVGTAADDANLLEGNFFFVFFYLLYQINSMIIITYYIK